MHGVSCGQRNSPRAFAAGLDKEPVPFRGTPEEMIEEGCRVVVLGVGLFFRHGRGVVASDEPLASVPLICVGVASLNDGACLGKSECIESCVHCRVAADQNGS